MQRWDTAALSPDETAWSQALSQDLAAALNANPSADAGRSLDHLLMVVWSLHREVLTVEETRATFTRFAEEAATRGNFGNPGCEA